MRFLDRIGPLAAMTGLFVLIAAIVALAAQGDFGKSTIVRTDVWLAVGLSGNRSDLLTGLFGAVTMLGSSVVIQALAATGVAYLLLRRRFADSALVALAVAGGSALNLALKAAIQRPRPDASAALEHHAGFSFPSAHTMTATILACLAAYLVSRELDSVPARVLTWAGALVVSVSVGASRVYLGAHYLSDVLAGFAAAAVWLAACLLAHRLLSRAPVAQLA